jgi:RNA 2',3'-cyclic 3'-phosphodiesterase
MSPALIVETAARPLQTTFWSDAFDPYAVADADVSGRPDTLFFALKPPPYIAEHIHRFSERARTARGLSCPLVVSRCYHITLLGAGAYETASKATLDGLRAAAARVAMRSFRIGFDRTVSFDNNRERPFVLVGDDRITIGAHMLRQELASALRQVGFRLRIKAFAPHMTLFYSGHDLGADSVAEIGWTVREFALIHSVHGQSRHELLGVWRLGAGA